MIFKSGEVYTGTWLDDKRHGHGENIWSDGTTSYEGEYLNGRIEG